MPYHAQLPLWDDKMPPEKIEALRAMLDDLYAYTLAEARRSYLEILKNIVPYDEAEEESISTMRRLIHEHPNIMAQNCEVGHITGSALVIDVSQGCVLLHHHKKLNRWLQFGGHADFETDFALVALREAQEETGLQDLHFYPDIKKGYPIDFDVHTIPARKNRPEHLHLDFRYLLSTKSSHLVNPPDAESQQIICVTFDEILNPQDAADDKLLDPALKRLIRKAKAIYENTLQN